MEGLCKVICLFVIACLVVSSANAIGLTVADSTADFQAAMAQDPNGKATQGFANWQYGVYMYEYMGDIVNEFHVSPVWDSPRKLWLDGEAYIGDYAMHPHSNDWWTCRLWTSEIDGTMNIHGKYVLNPSSADGIVLHIIVNGTEVWQLEVLPQQNPVNPYGDEVDYEVTGLDIGAGQSVVFAVSPNGTIQFDGCAWSQIIDLEPTTCAEVWAYGVGMSEDINKDCIVDFEDFAMMAAKWLVSNEPLPLP